MKRILVLSFIFLFSLVAMAQESKNSGFHNFIESLKLAAQNNVHAEFAVTWDGEEIAIARSDVEVHWGLGNRIEVFLRVNLLPYAAKSTIIEKLKQNEDIIAGVSAAIAQATRNAIALKLGIPAENVIVPQPVLRAAIAQNLASQIDAFVNSKITSDAQLNAALRELGFAITLFGSAPDAGQQMVLEAGILDPMYAGNDDPTKDPTLSKNHFRVSRPAVRLKYANHNIGLVVYLEAGNDAGLWEIANPQANAAAEWTATIVARHAGKFFDLTNVNSWEAGVSKTLGLSQKVTLVYGTRPVLDRGIDSSYMVVRYDWTTGGFIIDAQGSVEKFDDPIFGQIVAKRFEAGVARDIKGFNVGLRTYSRYNTTVRKDFSTVMAGFNKGLFGFSNFIVGVGARAYTYKYHGLDEDGNTNQWERGWDVGMGISGRPAVDPADVLFEHNQKLNDQRLKEKHKQEAAAKKAEKKK